MSLNDVCVFPAWFGGVATCLVAFLTAECSSATSAAIAALVMATALRTPCGPTPEDSTTSRSPPPPCASPSYPVPRPSHPRIVVDRRSRVWPAQVAAWGGYTFVLNMVGLHAAVIVLVGSFNSSVHKAYSLSDHRQRRRRAVPRAHPAPIKSMSSGSRGRLPRVPGVEPSAPSARRSFGSGRGASGGDTPSRLCAHRGCRRSRADGLVRSSSVRVRGLFIKHTKTGNPLVDSVAEHQPGSADAYFRYLHTPFYIAPAGRRGSRALRQRAPPAALLRCMPWWRTIRQPHGAPDHLLDPRQLPDWHRRGYVVDDALANIDGSSNLRTETTIRATVRTTRRQDPASKARSKANARRGGSEKSSSR